MGYLWVWMGSFRRWQRRFIVASEAPGVLLMYKSKNRKGKVRYTSVRVRPCVRLCTYRRLCLIVSLCVCVNVCVCALR